MKPINLAVVGGGAAGLLAAGMAADMGCNVTLFEPNRLLGRKLRITGKGRCNLTNACDAKDFAEKIPHGNRFLYSAVSRFTPYDTMDFFESVGVRLKIERGNRVFPQSDRADEVAQALVDFCKRGKVSVSHKRVDGLLFDDECVSGISVGGRRLPFDKVFIATGGRSYPATGSTGDGYRFAKEAGHTVSDLRPSLVPLITKEKWPICVQGLSLKNVRLTVADEKDKKNLYSRQGEALFTHFGVSGPLVLQASALMDNMESGRYKLFFDLKPALTEKMLEQRILRELDTAGGKTMGNLMRTLLPSRLIMPVCGLAEIPVSLPGNQMTKNQRKQLISVLKNLPLTVDGFRPWEEAVITSGGVSLNEINPKTMESKLKKGLYFVGEVLDADGYTGGFNLQIVWSTAAAAAKAVCDKN